MDVLALRDMIRKHDQQMRERKKACQPCPPSEKAVAAAANEAVSDKHASRASADIDNEKLQSFLRDVYPGASVHAQRITREETDLGRFSLDAERALYLGTENLGVFVSGCAGPCLLRSFLRELGNLRDGGMYVVVASSRELASELFCEWHPGEGKSQEKPSYWAAGKLIFSTPEGLRGIPSEMIGKPAPIAAIILLDKSCWLHKARGLPGQSEFTGNDRPQRVADFRSRLACGHWAPPLFVLTEKPAQSVNTVAMHSPYCLEGFWFLRGCTLVCSSDDCE